MQRQKIGLFGFGCVGQGLYDVLKGSLGMNAEIVKIGVKNPHKKRTLPPEMFTYNPTEILNDDEINLIVELIDDPSAAFEIVKSALTKGKNVVTANKKMVSENLKELINIQKNTGTSLLYEASSCGSIPIIRTLEEYYNNEYLHSVSGIFNGSSNYILTRMNADKMNYAEALKQAQDLGFAESDPTLDVGGFDPKYKLTILLAHAFGLVLHPSQILNMGIQTLHQNDLAFAREKSWKIKLTPKAYKTDSDTMTAYVLPSFVSKKNYLYNVEYEYNAVTVQAAFSQKQLFYGKGAGGHPTGSAVLSDISALGYDYRYEYKKMKDKELKFNPNVTVTAYLRFPDESVLNKIRFENIREKFESEKFRYAIGNIRLDEIGEKRDLILKSESFIAVLPEAEER